MVKISVVIPVYNVEKYIKRCVVSIQNQSLREIEIILVDDCSPDASIEIVKNLALQDNRIKILQHIENKGPMCARETGYMAAIGDYITFCDGDDSLPFNSLELLYGAAQISQADIISGNMTYIRDDGKKDIWRSTLNYGYDKHGAFKSLLMDELKHNLCSKLFRRDILKDYQYQTFLHCTNGEDGILFYQLINNISKIIQIDQPVYNYIQNNDSSSRIRYKDRAIECICIANRFRHDATIHYSDLDILRHRKITSVIYSLYSKGYGYGTHLNRYICEQGLSEYKKVFSKYFTLSESLKYLIKRYFVGFYSFVKNFQISN